MDSTLGCGVGEGVGAASISGWRLEIKAGVAVTLTEALSMLSREEVTITITARITATTRTSPKAICHLTLASALLLAAVPLMVPGVVPGVREL